MSEPGGVVGGAVEVDHRTGVPLHADEHRVRFQRGDAYTHFRYRNSCVRAAQNCLFTQ